MTVQMNPLEYESKSGEYFQWTRPEMLKFVPAHCRRVLDVGCAEGYFGEMLKKTRGIEVWGIEPTKSAAAAAQTKLDKVIEGTFEPESGLPAGAFDCVFFNDVLEHMAEPEQALRYARTLLAPGGVVVSSIPNVRYFPVLYKLVVRAEWEYQEFGILDRTHLRFFTRSSIVNMFKRAGFEIDSISGLNPNQQYRLLWPTLKMVNLLFRCHLNDTRFLQFAVVAKAAK